MQSGSGSSTGCHHSDRNLGYASAADTGTPLLTRTGTVPVEGVFPLCHIDIGEGNGRRFHIRIDEAVHRVRLGDRVGGVEIEKQARDR
ncbi:hypothetical protein CH291_07080 [Rhodococcus sp. 14-1411-2a]|nr:hypothetical protein CH291_07080 [Rhodococcus sp. 14-1411-2a]